MVWSFKNSTRNFLALQLEKGLYKTTVSKHQICTLCQVNNIIQFYWFWFCKTYLLQSFIMQFFYLTFMSDITQVAFSSPNPCDPVDMSPCWIPSSSFMDKGWEACSSSLHSWEKYSGLQPFYPPSVSWSLHGISWASSHPWLHYALNVLYV